ncbi:Replication initiation and membrane attachment protein [Rossellomorea vietnamensis]|uniref:Replication initiation and membrane attachment protein n=1 Tax=Rossellomorea vietnamensis TaxID=218284 RepID=A0A5D4MGY0_9BACI|nr:replication initiation and membrane attachment family protein [Rossellomorea vietnamensis]TYS00993.1 Replication initiation and membrane attachment protein [Rossellomorea vietnamensis]
MKNHWNKIQPVDRYTVCLNGVIQEYERKAVTFLYQPLIGPVCYSLYMTLLNEVEENKLNSEQSSHYHLMNFLSSNLPDVYEARMKLEGIGLLKTYEKQDGDPREFIYEVQPPLSPQQFFSDGMLNVYLFRKIGKTHFNRLKKFFCDDEKDFSQYREVTRSFQDIYTSSQSINLLDEEAESASSLSEGKRFTEPRNSSGVPVDTIDFDFDLLLAGLTQNMVPRRSFTPDVKDTVAKLSCLYSIDPLQMKNVVLSALTEDDEINIEELRKAARDWYQLHNAGDPLPDLQTKNEKPPEASRKPPATKEEELIEYLETTSPKEVLKDISGGIEPAKSDLQAIEEVMISKKLSTGVANVLLQYVLLKTDMKLTKGYVEKIASQWVRKKVSTAQEAMELAKKEHKEYLSWAEGKKDNKRNYKKPVRTEKLPDWFEEKPADQADKKPDQNSSSFEEQKRKLEEKLKKYRK